MRMNEKHHAKKIREIREGFKNRTSFKNTGTAFTLTNRAAMLYCRLTLIYEQP